MEPRLRIPTVDDVPALTGLLAALGHPAEDPGALVARIADWTSDDGAHLALAEGDGGAALGFAAARLVPYFHRAAPRVELTTLVVGPAARRGGVGRLLVDDVEAFALARGAAEILLTSNHARPEAHAFYRAHGFADQGATHVRYVRPAPFPAADGG